MRINEVAQPGLLTRGFYGIGKWIFGKVPTPERVMAHRLPLMLGIGALYGSIEWFAKIEASLRSLLNLHVARLYDTAY